MMTVNIIKVDSRMDPHRNENGWGQSSRGGWI